MDQFIKLTALTTYTFWVKDHKFEVAAKNRSDAMSIANTELWGLMAQAAVPNRFSEWVDLITPNTYVWTPQ